MRLQRSVLVLVAVVLGGACSSHSSHKATDDAAGRASPASTTVTEAGRPPTTSVVTCAPTTTAPADRGGKEVNPAGDIPDNQAFVAYSPAGGPYTVKVPEGWARTEGPRTVSFTDKFNTVRIDLVDAPQPPTVQSAQAEELPRLAASVPCFGAGKVTTVRRTSGNAVLITYQGDGPADPVTGKVVRADVERYEFWRGGTEAVLTLSGAVGSDNVDPWKMVTDSFTWR